MLIISRRTLFRVAVIAAFLMALIVAPATAERTSEVLSKTLAILANKDTVIRGNDFTVTIIGESITQYRLKIKDAGIADNDYPWIAEGQSGLQGTYNSRNILVETTAGGTRSIRFDTNSTTADRRFTIRVEDKDDPNTYDEVEVRVEKGDVTITTSGTGTYYIGEEIALSGTCTDNRDYVYLFLTGPNLNTNGVNLTHLWPVGMDSGETFTRVDVGPDGTWSYTWNTTDPIKNRRSIDAGGYTIYAVSKPRGRDQLSDSKYATVSINLRTGFLTVDPIGATVKKGTYLKISGTATGNPSYVYIWMFGEGYYGDFGKLKVREVGVAPDSSFKSWIGTEDLVTGQYFVIVQHPSNAIVTPIPGFNTAGSIFWDSSGIRGTGISSVTLTNLQAPAAANALINALASPNIPDLYVKLAFSLDTSQIWIDGISDQTYGEIFTVTGTSDYLAGTVLPYKIFAENSRVNVFSGEVIVGDNGDWSFEVDTTVIGPGAYTLWVTSPDDSASMIVSFDIYDDVIRPVPPAGAIYRVEKISITPSLDDLSPGDEVTLNGSIRLRGPLPEHYGYLEFSTDLPDPVWTYAFQVGGLTNSTSSTPVSSRSFALSAWELDYGHDRVYVLITLSGTVPKVGKDDPTLLRILERDSDGRTIPNSEHRLSFIPTGSSQSPISGKNLTLHPGWNFISIPRHLEAGNDTATIFPPVDAAGHSALRYDTAGRTWISLTPTDRLTPLEGIWIYSENLATIPLTFSTDLLLPPSERSLAQGWNAVGITGTVPATARDTLYSVKGQWSTLIGFDAGAQTFETGIVNGGSGANADTRSVYPGRGYWLYMTEPGNLCAIGM